MTDILALLASVVLTIGTGIFVASEFSLVTIDPAIVDDELPDNRRTRAIKYSLKHLSTELSAAQVGITVTTILLGYVAEPVLTRFFSGLFSSGPVASVGAATIGVVLALIVVNVFSMLFGELVPKNMALAKPWATAELAVPAQRLFTRAFRPVIVALNGSANWLLRRMGIEPREELSGARSAQELAALVRRSAQAGTLDMGTARLLTNSIDFDQLTASDVMTDRTRVHFLAQDDTAADVVALAARTGHSRFPVTGESTDDIVGLVHVRKAVAVPRDRRSHVPVTALMGEAPRVPETVGLRPLLVELRGFGLQMAVVVDEYAGTAGIVTLEDVVEELVGEVADEHDPRRQGTLRSADGSWLVPGLFRPDELAERTGIEVPTDPAYETLAGLVMARLGRLPEVGDTITVDGDEVHHSLVTITVRAMQGRRVDQVSVKETAE